MIPRITILCVTYHSDDCCRKYTDSIRRAAEKVSDRAVVDIHVAVNDNDNRGYFGGIKELIRTGYEESDYVIISNVDLLMQEDFFEHLLELKLNDEIGCIAPSIYSESEQQERNPEYAVRPQKSRLRIARLLYIHPLVFHLYKNLVYRKRQPKKTPSADCYIYAPHGSFMIFTNDIWLRRVVMNFEPFLYGEEIYLAEQLKKAGMKTLFAPKLRIRDLDHISTSTLPSKLICKCHREALGFILKDF